MKRALRILRAIALVTGGAALLVLAAYLAVTVKPEVVIVGTSALIALGIIIVVAAVFIPGRDPLGGHAGISDPDEHLEPFRQRGAKFERAMRAEFRWRGLLPVNRVSASTRKLRVALDRSRPASRGRLALAATKAFGRRLAMGPVSLISQAERREAREAVAAARAAERGKHRAQRAPSAAPLLPGPDPFAFLAAPLAPLPAGPVFAEKTLQPADRLPLHSSLAQGQPAIQADDPLAVELAARDYREPEDPGDLLTDEEEADVLVGPVTPDGTEEPEPVLDTRCGQCGEDWMADPECGCRCTREDSAPAAALPGSDFRDWERDSIVMKAIRAVRQ